MVDRRRTRARASVHRIQSVCTPGGHHGGPKVATARGVHGGRCARRVRFSDDRVWICARQVVTGRVRSEVKPIDFMFWHFGGKLSNSAGLLLKSGIQRIVV